LPDIPAVNFNVLAVLSGYFPFVLYALFR